MQSAREIVLRYGWNATSYQILNPGFELWFSKKFDAVAGYVEHYGIRVVAGVPVCDETHLKEVIDEFEAACAEAGCDVAYFATEARTSHIWSDSDDRLAIVIGAQPVWRPQELVDAMRSRSSLRAQLNRAANKGLRVEEWPCDRAEHSAELRNTLNEWLDGRGLPPLHFLVEPDTLPSLLDRRIFVAMREQNVKGFLVAAPIRGRNGWLVEQNVRGAEAPNGTTEALLFAAAEWMTQHNSDVITLGLSPLSVNAPQSETAPPRSIRALFAWLKIHGRRFYNFEGLDKYKSKFQPREWEPIYAVIPKKHHSWRALVAIGAAFGGTSVIPFAAKVVRHAVSQELRYARRRIQKPFSKEDKKENAAQQP